MQWLESHRVMLKSGFDSQHILDVLSGNICRYLYFVTRMSEHVKVSMLLMLWERAIKIFKQVLLNYSDYSAMWIILSLKIYHHQIDIWIRDFTTSSQELRSLAHEPDSPLIMLFIKKHFKHQCRVYSIKAPECGKIQNRNKSMLTTCATIWLIIWCRSMHSSHLKLNLWLCISQGTHTDQIDSVTG